MLCALAGLGTIGCSGSDPSGPGDDGTPDGTVVGPAGGTFGFAAGAVTLSVPAGALAADTEISVSARSSHPASDAYAPGTCFEFAPDGLSFAAPVTLTIAYDEATLPAGVGESSLELCEIVGDEWAVVPGYSVDTTANTLSAPIDGFSGYGAVGLDTASGTIYEGQYRIYDQATYDACLAYTGITGGLRIEGGGLTEVELPALEFIGGDLTVYHGAFTRISLPELRSIGLRLNLDAPLSLAAVELPQCTRVGTIVIRECQALTTLDDLAGIRTLNPLDLTNYGAIVLVHNWHLDNLDGLAGIGGRVGAVGVEYCYALTSIAGLGGITIAERGFSITQCNALVSLTGLGLTEVHSHCQIWGNAGLTSLTGLERLHRVDGYLQIENNQGLTNLTGLSSLVYVGGLSFQYCDALTSLDGLAALPGLPNGGIFINDCPQLADITALSSIQTLDTHLDIEVCPGLVSLAGLENLVSIGSDLRLEDNYNLESIEALGALRHVDGGIVIDHNHNLESLNPLLGLQPSADTGYLCNFFVVTNNCGFPPGCMGNAHVWEVLEALGGEDMVSGAVVISGN
ncbi:hypothetical protein FJ251_02720 [bacterium]|nr:hypothetical protein [bacterium]